MSKEASRNLLNLAEDVCRQRGARLTPQRRRVLEILCASGRPLSAYEILERMRTAHKSPAPPTVYRALEFLLEQGLAHKLESLHAYIGCSHPEHPHAGQFLICADCGGVDEMDSDEIAHSLRATEQAKGFRTRHPVVELLGTCARCADKQTSANPSPQ